LDFTDRLLILEKGSQMADFKLCGRIIAAACLSLALPGLAAATDGPGPKPRGGGPGCDLFPAPASVGATVDLSYFGPPPSESNPSLVGPLQLLRSGKVDSIKGTITIPLYKGHLRTGNKIVWYVLTDTSDAAQASALGLNFSAKLSFAANGARKAVLRSDGSLLFDNGAVDFSQKRKLVPGPIDRPFPPKTAHPGSIGDRGYSPLVQIRNAGGVIYNAPIIAFDVAESQISFPKGGVDYSKVHDQVVAIDPIKRTVTFNLVNGFSFGRPVWYISTDANNPTLAAIEGGTYAPFLSNIETGSDDSFSSAVERLFVAVNGPLDCKNPQRQGLFAALTDGFRPNNVVGGIPTIANDYSPLWDVQPYEWTAQAVAKGYRSQLREEFQILTLVQNGFLTGLNGAPFGTTNMINNCPIVQRLL
jgi:hypothetical protein